VFLQPGLGTRRRWGGKHYRRSLAEKSRVTHFAKRDIISFTPVRMLADCVEASKS